MNPTSADVLVVSAILFAIGLFGVMARRDPLARTGALAVLLSAPLFAVAAFSQTGAAGVGENVGSAVAFVLAVGFATVLVLGVAVLMLAQRRAALEPDIDEARD